MSKPIRLDLMPRDEFAKLSLHAKNDYLQKLADTFADADLERQPLDKDALSRLRRYYSRRVFADLRLEGKPDTGLDATLRRLGEAIRAKNVNTDIEAVLAQEIPRRVLRAPPSDDDQDELFFVPGIYDAPIKDDVNLMDVAPFTLGKNVRQGLSPTNSRTVSSRLKGRRRRPGDRVRLRHFPQHGVPSGR